jgi:signal transduction histidine kinase
MLIKKDETRRIKGRGFLIRRKHEYGTIKVSVSCRCRLAIFYRWPIPMQSHQTESTIPKLERWPSAIAILTGLALMLYLNMMLMAQNKAQVGANRLFEKHIVREARILEKILSIYIDQCRGNIVSLAQSQPLIIYLESLALGTAPTGSDTVKKAVDSWLGADRLDNHAVFHRIVISDDKRHTVYDTQDFSLSADSGPTALDQIHIEKASEGVVFTTDHQIVISSPAIVNGKAAGRVTAWLNTTTLYRQFLANIDGSIHVSTLISCSGTIFFPEDLPSEIQSCGLGEIETISPNTLSTIRISCHGQKEGPRDYLSIKLPIADTPLMVLSILPKSKVAGMTLPWLHEIIMATLSIIFISLFFIQLRTIRKHTELKTRYTEADKQHRTMVQNNEQLANEIILRKQAEAELKIINEHLEEIVKHRTSKLEGIMNDLRETQSQLIQTGKLASIGELAAGIAHELNQPLMVIRGNTQLFSRMMNKSKDTVDQLPAFFDTVERNTERMIQIINHLRSFSRQSGTEMKPVDINQVINDAFLMIGEQLRLHNIETVRTSVENLPTIKGNPYQLEQVVLNLIANARDAIESYQPAENEYRKKKLIKITTRLKNGSKEAVEILFSDTGCGIRQEDKEKIFDPFFTTKAVGKGTGLGLSITYGILQEHNGYLEIVDTSPGHTTFSIVLPAA